MANVNLSNKEMIALGDAVINTYCSAINEDFSEFRKNLTGNLRTYENIGDAITDHLNDENILSYVNSIQESALKLELKKWMNEKKSSKYTTLAGPWVSSNNLRKLIFYGPKEQSSSFKEFFVFGCYIYACVDRNVLLKDLSLDASVAGRTLGLPQFVPGLNTVNPYKLPINKKFSLTALNNKMEASTRLTFEYNEEPVLLNRANIDADNNTITSKVQAFVYATDGDWYIENQSDQKTTFIQVTKPTKLEKGDIIVLGNRYFLFEG